MLWNVHIVSRVYCVHVHVLPHSFPLSNVFRSVAKHPNTFVYGCTMHKGRTAGREGERIGRVRSSRRIIAQWMINAYCSLWRQTPPQSLQHEAGRARSPFVSPRQYTSPNPCSRIRGDLLSKCTCQLEIQLERKPSGRTSDGVDGSDLQQIAICISFFELFPPFCRTRECGEFHNSDKSALDWRRTCLSRIWLRTVYLVANIALSSVEVTKRI